MIHGYRYALALLLFSVMVAPVQAQIYVDVDAGGAGNGSSWTDAYTNLQDALDAAGSNDEIWIAEGVYYPDEGSGVQQNDSGASFVVTGDQNGLEIYGGFDPSSGDETFADRDSDANVTVLSGDIDADDGGGDNNKTPAGITPTASDTVGTNSTHVFIFNGGSAIGANVSANITNATVLDGVVVTAGQANGSDQARRGGGVYCDGAGIDDQCNPTLRNVSFFGNYAVFGGAISNQTSGSDGNGGISSPRIVDATFAGNAAGRFGGAIYNRVPFGGNSSPQIINAVFAGNSAAAGGAICNAAPGGTSSPEITNATFAGNSAEGTAGVGGAMYNLTDQVVGSINPQIANTIFWGNQADNDGDAIFNSGDASVTVDYSIVEGGDAGIANGDGFSSGTDNLDQDPQFADAATPAGSDGLLGTPDDGLRLQGPGSGGGASPAIDAGDNGAIARSDDLIGNDRTQQVVGNAATVDLGAYESTGAALPVELASFEGTRTDDGSVRLTWRTASETGNAGFDVLRTTGDGASWTKVGFREGAGTTSQPQTYRLTDTDLPYAADSLRYRLRQVDTDGTTTLTDPVTVALGGPAQLALRGTAPNPARSRATVRFAVPDGVDAETVTLELYDVLGRQVRAVDVRAEAGRQTATIDVSGLTSGMYILRLQADGRTETRKLTVVR